MKYKELSFTITVVFVYEDSDVDEVVYIQLGHQI